MRTVNLIELFKHLEEDYRKQIDVLIAKIGVVILFWHFVDIAESYLYDYMASLYWEIARIVVVLAFLIPNRLFGVGNKFLPYNILIWPLLYFYGTLWIPDENYFLTLPWLVFMGILPFWLLEIEKALQWAVIQVAVLGIVALLSSVGLVHTLYNSSLLWQEWGVLGLTVYIVYSIENKRALYMDKIRSLAMENRLLYEEMMHRTKNNLQLIIGLMEQEQDIHNEETKEETLTKLAYRVRAFDAILASRTEENEGRTDLNQLVRHIVEVYHWEKNCDISFTLEPATMKHKSANHLALIVNEAINNIQKHACPNGADRIEIRLEKLYGTTLRLTIKDNGRKEPVTIKEGSGGMKFMMRLAETLPAGDLMQVYDKGMKIELTFRIEDASGTQTNTE